MKTVVEVNAANFKTEVLESAQPVVLDFWAEWCGPCRRLGPLLEEIAVEQAGRVRIAKVNVDENPELAAQFDIRSIPTLLFFAGGQVRQQVVGAVDKKTIVSKLQELPAAA